MLQAVAVCCRLLSLRNWYGYMRVWVHVGVSISVALLMEDVLQCVVVFVLQCVAVCCSVLQCV